MTSPGNSPYLTSCLLTWLALIIRQVHSSTSLAPITPLVAPNANFSTYVTHGHIAPKGKYPFVVSIMYKGEHVCGGSILNGRTILTAAHCFDDPNTVRDHIVYVGSTDVSKINRKFKYLVDRFIWHGGFNISNMLNGFDIGVIKLKKSIDFRRLTSRRAAKTCLPRNGADRPNLKYHCTVIGWGTDENKKVSPLLKESDFWIQKATECKKHKKNYRTRDLYCAIGDSGEASCQGDSGGPIICRASNGRWLQFGIVSFGALDCKDLPTYFTKVNMYIKWIQKHA